MPLVSITNKTDHHNMSKILLIQKDPNPYVNKTTKIKNSSDN